MSGVASTVEFAPMVSIVFLAMRMRALQHYTQPNEFAVNAMYATTYSLVLTAILALVVPLMLGGKHKVDPVTKEVTIESENATLGKILLGVRVATTICVYGGIACVIWSIYNFKAPAGQPTAPVSPTVECTVALCCQFFLVYGVIVGFTTVSELTGIPLE